MDVLDEAIEEFWQISQIDKVGLRKFCLGAYWGDYPEDAQPTIEQMAQEIREETKRWKIILNIPVEIRENPITFSKALSEVEL